MHPFGIDSNERFRVFVVLVPVSFWLSDLFRRLVDAAGWRSPEPLDWIFDPASAIAWFGILYWLFEHYIWKWPLLHAAGLLQTPDLNGRWSGILQSSHDEFTVDHEIEISIKQSWTQLVVELNSARSNSKNDTASVFVCKGVNSFLVYTYLNTPGADQVETMSIHTGTSKLELRDSEHGMQLTGTYYNDRGRRNFGRITVYKMVTENS